MSVMLGVNMSGRDSSAAVVVDGRIRFAVREERLNREKKTRRFPMLAIQACLDAAGCSIDEAEKIGISWNPAINLERFNAAQSSVARYKPEHFYGVPSHLMLLRPAEACTVSEQRFAFDGGAEMNIAYLNHHLCHAADSFLHSPFDEAAILVVDAYGEKDSVTFARGRGSAIEVLKTIQFPYSLGSFYGTMTQLLGFTADLDEWKVMGASPYGDPGRFYEPLRKLFTLKEDGTFEMDLAYFHYPLFSRPVMYSENLTALIGPARDARQELTQRDYDLAAATQRVTEEVAFHMLRHLQRITGLPSLCLSGGVAMNCVLNGKATSATPFTQVHVGSSADDGGTSVGAALYLASREEGYQREIVRDNYWGPEFSDEEIESELKKFGLCYRRLGDPSAEAAERIARGEIIGWFQGRVEFGERALGNRSILADPRDASMKDRVNSAIKYRESFRPFAPSIPEEMVADYFENATPVPFMEKALIVRKEKRSIIPAVTHVDGSGRVQTVSRDVNPRYWQVIEEFRKRTGVPVVLNTSFNLQGEPIVTAPRDAVRTFFSSGLNALIIGNFLVEKALPPQ